MKKVLLSYFLITCCITCLKGQTLSTFLETDSNGCYGLTADEDFIYVVSSFNGKVFRKNVSSTTADYDTFNIGGSGYAGVCKAGNYIYIAKPANGAPGIYRFDPDADTTGLESFLSLNTSYGLAAGDSELYVSSADKIYKIALNTSSPTAIQISDNINGTDGFDGSTIGLKVYGNDLFVSDANGIARINLSSGNYEKEIVTTHTGKSFTRGNSNDIFYVTNDNSVYEVNTQTQAYSLLITIDNFIGTYDITFKDDSLFVTTLEGGYNKVARIDLSSLTVDTVTKDGIALYPNPAAEYINITEAEPSGTISIIAPNGQVVKTMKAENNKIDISDLNAGVYFIKTNNFYKRFIKQ